MAEMLKSDKGFDRILFNCMENKLEVRVGLETTSLVGVLVQLEGHVLTMEVNSDRFNKEYIYIPVQGIRYIAHAK